MKPLDGLGVNKGAAMKNMLCRVHSKWSLLAALFPRLWFYEDALWRNFPNLWQHRLELPHGDYVTFFPYIISVGGIQLNLKNKRLSGGWRKKTVKDPINIAAYGVSPKEFIGLLAQANPQWQPFLGSSYFLYGPVHDGWQASIAVKMGIHKESGERHHIRLFGLKTARGEKLTLGAAHHDWPYHTEEEPPFAWNETRDIVASSLASAGLSTICGLSEQVTDINWRGARGDGKILIINCK
jgi:hypothetical protein